MSASNDRPAASASERPPLAAWKKITFALALVVGLVGLALTRGRAEPSANQAARSGSSQPLGLDASPSSFDLGGQRFPGETAEPEQSPWAPLAMKGGLSFAVAFAAGYALRTFLKMTIVVAGVVALAIFGLQKAGIVGEVDWSKAQGYWDSLTANVGEQFTSFKTFVTGSLPSAGAGTVGLLSGFRR